MHVVVVGAGVAGLSAAATLRRHDCAVTVIEAGQRIGGRAWTTTPPELAQPFDHGASWLHAAHRNPLAALARDAGEALIDSEASRIRQTYRDGRPATQPEMAEYDAAGQAWHGIAAKSLAAPADMTLAEAAALRSDLPWLPSVLNWEGPVIAAADSRALSLRDWHTNLLDGVNLEVAGGLGAFIARRLASPAGPVHLGIPATAVAWDGGGVAVTTPSGVLRADACIVTVSTGVLRSGVIAFTPALPEAIRQALDQLPMGLLDKVAFRAAGPGRLGLPPATGVDQFVPAIDDPAMSFICWPHGMDHVIGFMGGSAAAALDRAGKGAMLAYARDQLRQVFGADALRSFKPDAVATGWASDPLTLGSYAYAIPGGAGARAILGTPLPGGRLIFAGEAVRTDGLAGTVGGAFLAGEHAAATILGTR